MRRLCLCIFFTIVVISTGFCQVKDNNRSKILFQGLVIDAANLSAISNSQISINRIFSAVSGSDGTFAFYVNKKDTVIFYSLGYKPATMMISDTLRGNEFIAGIYMQTDTASIGEVVIVPRYKNLKSEIMNASSENRSLTDNARYNVAVSAYQGRNSISNLGDPASNYEMLRQKQKVNAYERGGIPSDRILGLSPLMLIPAAYLLIKGLPPRPAPFKPDLTPYELDQIQQKYLEMLKKK